MDPGRLRRGGLFVETDAHRDTVPAIRDRLPDLRARVADRRRRPARSTCSRRAARAVAAARTIERRRRRRQGRRPRHDHLHQRHHRPAQGLHDHPPQHATPTSPTPCPGCTTCSTRAPRRCCSCRWRTRFARLIQIGVVQARARMAHTADTKNLVATLRSFQPDVRAVGAAGLREGLQHGASSGRTPTARAPSSTGRSGSAIAYSEALDDPGGPGLAAARRSTRCSTGSSTAGCAPRSAGGAARRSPAARRSASGSPLLPRHRGDRLRGVRADRDLAGGRGQPATRASGSAPSAARCPASPSASPTTARS